jgi:hypothetical protein
MIDRDHEYVATPTVLIPLKLDAIMATTQQALGIGSVLLRPWRSDCRSCAASAGDG